jgi:hypothetical protein
LDGESAAAFAKTVDATSGSFEDHDMLLASAELDCTMTLA